MLPAATVISKPQFALPTHHRVPEGAMKCSDCHNPHGTSNRAELVRNGSETCIQCHAEKRGPFVFEHPASKIEGCIACHTPHGSINRMLLARREERFRCPRMPRESYRRQRAAQPPELPDTTAPAPAATRASMDRTSMWTSCIKRPAMEETTTHRTSHSSRSRAGPRTTPRNPSYWADSRTPAPSPPATVSPTSAVTVRNPIRSCSILNSGFRLLDFSLFGKVPRDEQSFRRRLLLLTLSGIGGDPYASGQLTVRKNNLYDLRVNFRQSYYYWNMNDLAALPSGLDFGLTNNHNWATVRKMGSVNLLVDPRHEKSAFQLRVLPQHSRRRHPNHALFWITSEIPLPSAPSPARILI